MKEILTIKQLIDNSANNYGELIAFQIKRNNSYRKYTYKLVKEIISSLAAYLIRNGINPRDRIAILSENRPEWAISYLAVASIGAINVPIDAKLTRQEIDIFLKDSEAKILIISSALDKEYNFKHKLLLMEEIEECAPATMPDVIVKEDDVAAIVYTSGTTGNPKGIMLTHKNIMSNVLAAVKSFNVGPGDNFLSILSLQHTFETTAGFLSPFLSGATVTFAESLKSYHLLADMQETGVTIICGVPLLYNIFYQNIIREVEGKGLLSAIIFNLLINVSKLLQFNFMSRILFLAIHNKFGGKIRFFISGGAAISPDLIKNYEVFGFTILQGYGLTEAAPILACCTMRHNRIGSVGKPLENVEIKFTEDGEILARGPNIMKGYYKRTDLTAEAIKAGWLYTGDVGCFDKDGYLYITGRIKDIIVTGAGVNVYPEEIELFIDKIPGVKESCVFGVKAVNGLRKEMEDVWAIIVPNYEYFKKKEFPSDPLNVERHIKNEVNKLNIKLTESKRIANVLIRDADFPRTALRKIKKFRVKEEMGL